MPDTTPIYGLPFYITATDPPDLGQATEDLALAVEGELQRIDGDIATLNGLSLATGASTDVEGPYSSTTPTAGAAACAAAFTAPDSGAVVVWWHADFWASQIDKVSFVSCEVRSGAVIGGGSVVSGYGANSNDALKVSGVVQGGQEARIAAATFRPVTGLTPGNSYHVRLMHFTETAGNIQVFYRKVMVQPQL